MRFIKEVPTEWLVDWVREGEVKGTVRSKYTRVIVVSTTNEAKRIVGKYGLNHEQVASIHSWMSRGLSAQDGVDVAFHELENILNVLAGSSRPHFATVTLPVEEL